MKDLVVGYKESMSTGLCVPPSIAIGLTDEKIERIVANVEKIDSKLFLVNIIGIVENKTLNKILNIINMVFGDMEITAIDTPVEKMTLDDSTKYFSDNDSVISLLCTDSSDDDFN